MLCFSVTQTYVNENEIDKFPMEDTETQARLNSIMDW